MSFFLLGGYFAQVSKLTEIRMQIEMTRQIASSCSSIFHKFPEQYEKDFDIFGLTSG
jgi:hypothetical protein